MSYNLELPGVCDLASIRKQVEFRITEEAKEYKLKDNEDKSEKTISSKFVFDCLRSNELGDGLLYTELLRDKYLYVNNSAEWLTWNDHSWRRDHMNFATAAVEDVVDRYRQELPALGEKLSDAIKNNDEEARAKVQKTQDSIVKRILRLRSEKGRNNCLKFAQTNKNPLAIQGGELDMQPWKLACGNGVIDLKTGELGQGQANDYISKRSLVDWHGIETPADEWASALMDIYDKDEELIAYIQRLFGYALTGLNTEHVFPVFHGQGRNGKSLVLETISYVLGDHAGPVPAEMLLDNSRASNSSGPTPELMALKGLRIAIASETDDGKRFSPARVKWLTGGDELTGRGLHDKYLMTFNPTHLLILITNHKPHAPAHDFAFWERAFLIPHNLSFVDREPKASNERRADKGLREKFQKSAPGILAWLVKGCLLWQKHGLNPPASVKEATADYKRDEDLLADFLDDYCIIESGAYTEASELYKGFQTWYEENIGKKIPSQKRFGKFMTDSRRFEKKKTNGKARYYGLALRAEAAETLL